MRERRRTVVGFSAVIAVLVFAATILGGAFSQLQTTRTVSSAGSIKGVGVGIYWNSACTNQTSSINWGLLDPGSTKTLAVYVRNEGNTAATLSKMTQNWNPLNASVYMALNWNYTNQILSPGQVLPVALTLTVSSTIAGISNFSFDTTITAIG